MESSCELKNDLKYLYINLKLCLSINWMLHVLKDMER